MLIDWIAHNVDPRILSCYSNDRSSTKLTRQCLQHFRCILDDSSDSNNVERVVKEFTLDRLD